jgi:DNA polymerase-3 subunit delta'
VDYSQIIGQKKSIDYFRKSISNNKHNHALIFEGEDGTGKMLLASVYAKALLCKSDSYDKPCNECLSCTKFEHGNNLDFKIVEPKTKKSVSTEDISSMLSDAHLIPNDGGRKVYIIQKAHLMTTAAQNKLLKILEEPPEYLTIMLLCDNISNVLTTIISRAVTIKMQKLMLQEVEQELVKRGVDKTLAKEVASYSGGNLGFAIDIAQDKKMLNKYQEYKDIFFSLEKNKVAAFSYLDKNSAEISDILACWQKILSDCLNIKAGIRNGAYDESEIKYAQKHEIDDIIDKLNYLTQAEIRLAGNAQYLPTMDLLLYNL